MGKKKTNGMGIVFDVDCANRIADVLDADVLLINSEIKRGLDNKLIIEVTKRKLRGNIFLILVTPGGDADAAYRIARCLQDYYEKFIAFITGYCKSAGTLCILGATEIVMSDMGELGPLDVQVSKKDELFELSSGLIAQEALQVLQGKAIEMFEDYMLAIKIHSGGQITFKTASEIALKISVGLMEPLYSQIDPIQVGEAARSMRIATAYGERLMIKSKNFSEITLEALRDTYPSHGFVIDKREVKHLFNNVRASSEDEDRLRQSLGELGYVPSEGIMYVQFLSDEVKERENGKDAKDSKEGRIKKDNRRTSGIKENS